MALILELKKRSQAERIAICETLLAGIWEEILAGNVDKSILQTAVYCQADLARIVWRLNRRGKCPYTDKYCEDWNCVKCDVNQDEIQFLQEMQKELDEEGDNNG